VTTYWYDDVEVELFGYVTVDFVKAHEWIQIGDIKSFFGSSPARWHGASEGQLEKMLPNVVKNYFIRAMAEIDMSNLTPGVGMIGDKPSKELSDLVPGVGVIGHPLFRGFDNLEEDYVRFSIDVELSVETDTEGDKAVKEKVDLWWEKLSRGLEVTGDGVIGMQGVAKSINNVGVEIINLRKPMQFEKRDLGRVDNEIEGLLE